MPKSHYLLLKGVVAGAIPLLFVLGCMFSNYVFSSGTPLLTMLLQGPDRT